MKYPPRPLSRFAATPSTISAHNSHLQIDRKRLRSTIDFQLLSFHRLMNCCFRNPLLFTNFCVAPCYFQIPPSKEAPQSQFTRTKAALLSTFRMNTCKSVSKQTTLTLFRMNTYAKTGGGGPHPSPMRVLSLTATRGRCTVPAPRFLPPESHQSTAGSSV